MWFLALSLLFPLYVYIKTVKHKKVLKNIQEIYIIEIFLNNYV